MMMVELEYKNKESDLIFTTIVTDIEINIGDIVYLSSNDCVRIDRRYLICNSPNGVKNQVSRIKFYGVEL